MLIPQGWAFFTKNPRDPQVFIYQVDTIDDSIKLENLRNTQLKYLFGIDRSNRKISSKLSKILQGVDSEFFYTSKKSVEDSIKNDYCSIFKVKVSVKKPILCGLYCLQIKKPKPWSWLRIDTNIITESSIILLNLKCI